MLDKGCQNLAKQIENMKLFGIPVVVTVNRFAADTDAEVELVQKKRARVRRRGLQPDHGASRRRRRRASKRPTRSSRPASGPATSSSSIRTDASIKEKIETIATKVYGADGVDYMPEAEQKIKSFTEAGYDKLPICMAKTHLSLSHDPTLKNRPTGFRVPIRDIRPSIGAGFLYPMLGAMSTMPGLPERPAAVDVDIDVETGRIKGLF